MLLVVLLTACSTNVVQEQPKTALEQPSYMKAIEELRTNNINRVNQVYSELDIYQKTVFSVFPIEDIEKHLMELDYPNLNNLKPVPAIDKAE
jgi:hypothetical protein